MKTQAQSARVRTRTRVRILAQRETFLSYIARVPREMQSRRCDGKERREGRIRDTTVDIPLDRTELGEREKESISGSEGDRNVIERHR